MTSSFLVPPSTPTGNHRCIELAGMDLWLSARIDNVFVYPGEIEVNQLREALGQTLSLWPLVAGRILLENDQRYMIELCDNPIPLQFVVDNDLEEWPLSSNVIVDASDKLLPTFIDQVQITKSFIHAKDEPLVRLKVTQIVQSDEWVLGVSWYHPLGDAETCLQFSNVLSRFYQQLPPLPPSPLFERRLWREEAADRSALPIPKQFRDAKSTEEVSKTSETLQLDYDPVCLHFSGEQLATLRMLAGGMSVSIQDALTAYIIVTLNTYCYANNVERRVLHTINIVNLHGVSDAIAASGQASNALFMMLSDDFDDPYSLTNVAQKIRLSILRSRNSQLLEPAIAVVDGLMRKNARENKRPDPSLIPNEIAVNSNLKYDWAGLVDFGHTDKCRFYTAGMRALYLRVFRLNPEKHRDRWLPRDRNGAEVSFRLETEVKEEFVSAWKRDLAENFVKVKR